MVRARAVAIFANNKLANGCEAESAITDVLERDQQKRFTKRQDDDHGINLNEFRVIL
jgi:hypothetical protein